MIKPAGHRVVVQPDKVLEEVTASGIVVQYKDKEREEAGSFYGTLTHVGPNAWKAFDDGNSWASVGDRVCFSRYAGRYIDDPDNPDTKYILLNDEDILAVITKGAN